MMNRILTGLVVALAWSGVLAAETPAASGTMGAVEARSIFTVKVGRPVGDYGSIARPSGSNEFYRIDLRAVDAQALKPRSRVDTACWPRMLVCNAKTGLIEAAAGHETFADKEDGDVFIASLVMTMRKAFRSEPHHVTGRPSLIVWMYTDAGESKVLLVETKKDVDSGKHVAHLYVMRRESVFARTAIDGMGLDGQPGKAKPGSILNLDFGAVPSVK